MSWKDAVMNVVTEMLAEVEDLKGDADSGKAYVRSSLKGYARTLKAICDSVGDTPAPTPPAPTPIGAYPYLGGMSAELQNHLMVEKAREEHRKKKATEVVEERHDGDGVLLVGGPADGTFTTVDPNMPVGARTNIGGGVYQLTFDGNSNIRRLSFDPEQTERVKLALLVRKGGD